MSERTPKMSTIRHTWAKGHPFPLTTDIEERYAEFDRWLADYTAKVCASVLAEQGESEWEYGAQHSQGTNPHPSLKAAQEMVAWHLAGEPRLRPEARGRVALVRRRKAGPWEPVPTTENEGESND
ncbi:hypothetical protein [Microbacterium sp. MYb64]|uniref:hypothetical protein n=1 Tax=Microbacterium sp. MYb64 TaxID=1848691 RepID=UPI0015E46BF2|nr:hypothetical protein [Microbacterium sp. MYb64]